MPFYIMQQYTLIEGSASVGKVPSGFEPSQWLEGKPMSDPAGGKRLELDLSLESGDYRGDIIDGIVTLYSDELKDALIELGVDNIQYYPVALRDQKSNEREGGYWLANVIGLPDCIDMEKSRMKHWPSGRGFDFLSMAIDEEKTNGLKVFRLKEDPTKVIISEEIKQYFDETDMLHGVELIQTEDYSDW